MTLTQLYGSQCDWELHHHTQQPQLDSPRRYQRQPLEPHESMEFRDHRYQRQRDSPRRQQRHHQQQLQQQLDSPRHHQCQPLQLREPMTVTDSLLSAASASASSAASALRAHYYEDLDLLQMPALPAFPANPQNIHRFYNDQLSQQLQCSARAGEMIDGAPEEAPPPESRRRSPPSSGACLEEWARSHFIASLRAEPQDKTSGKLESAQLFQHDQAHSVGVYSGKRHNYRSSLPTTPRSSSWWNWEEGLRGGPAGGNYLDCSLTPQYPLRISNVRNRS
eukprot:TRINITY_DN10084_c0_g1_i7.p1 TRINITY_DN10084_c0_g1~~TRINITY_DN10084_c0_g1_i7.p1  ORF type:complete len:278 (+),score=45.17 TRINITY_DN10084_c0_g1_i7:942-1775(+)